MSPRKADPDKQREPTRRVVDFVSTESQQYGYSVTCWTANSDPILVALDGSNDTCGRMVEAIRRALATYEGWSR